MGRSHFASRQSYPFLGKVGHLLTAGVLPQQPKVMLVKGLVTSMLGFDLGNLLDIPPAQGRRLEQIQMRALRRATGQARFGSSLSSVLFTTAAAATAATPLPVTTLAILLETFVSATALIGVRIAGAVS